MDPDAVVVRVDKDRCVGHARCNAISPEVYPVDEIGFVDITEVTVLGELAHAARAGAAACPEEAITVEPLSPGAARSNP